MTLPYPLRERLKEAAAVLEWSTGDWVLAAAGEHGAALDAALGDVTVPRRTRVDHASFTALYLTEEERRELDDQAVACGLNRSAFVTAVTRLGLGEDLQTVVDDLRGTAPDGADPGSGPD